ncbi:L-threonylcarbamoyladenylate synthase [Marinicella sediminis]|uniref:Threonylcarbamoyl-AMP synthase n=1 Tax=Marinicella sediminis TaxID=1792834 RepID=A0ABV7JA82_9GAMM|nr:L-threonylcarbamoyladenylate synthase [Marinicella sediminis]
MTARGQSIEQAVKVVQQGGLLVYPTEAVFGLGCDHRNEQAVQHLLKLKQRPVSKGLILVASHIQQIMPLIRPARRTHLARALKTWPGHHTWVFPKSDAVPDWISGDHETLAVRVSAHPTVKQLCDQLNAPLVSTSANISGQMTPANCQEMIRIWGDQVAYYLDQPLGGLDTPSPIRMASDGSSFR